MPNTKIKTFSSFLLKEEKGYIKSVHYNLANGYVIICHIFQDWEYVELIVESQRGGSVSVNMNIDDAVPNFIECFQSINNEIKGCRN